ncbi:MAG: hypothetical protein J6Q42_04835, partial [Clostridia bacterium]|nr:hypothetical protein [Clostridia bacterium]
MNNNRGTFTINGGTIIGNRGGNGAGVENSATIFMNGGNFQKNTTTGYGGGVYNYTNTFKMKGGIIADNSARIGTGVYNDKSAAIFTMEGGGIIDKIYRNNGTITINGGYFSVDAKNSIDKAWLGEGLIWGNNSGNDARYPKVDFPHKPEGIPYITVIKSNGTTPITDLTTFSALSSDGATYKLLRNVQLINDLTVPANASVTLDLNGFVLKGTGKGSVITVNKDLTLIDSNSTAVHKYTKADNGLYTWDEANGTIELAGGVITGGYGDSNGGGVNNKATFTMDGGNIIGNRAKVDGGGLYNKDGTAYVNGGIIEGNTAGTGGGGIWTQKSLTVSGGVIRDNIAGSDTGYNIEVSTSNNTATFNMKGGEIYGTAGSSIRIYGSQATFTMTGGGIIGKIASANKSTITISGGFFGTDAKNSIDTSWVTKDSEWGDNDGSDALYSTADYPHKLSAPYVAVTKDGRTSYIDKEGLKTFSALSSDGATYKLLRNVELVSAPLTVPDTATVTLDLNGFVLKGTGTAGVITNNGNLTLIDSNASAVHKYTKGDDGLYTWDDANGTITVKGGAITGGNVSSGGGVDNNGTFTMESGSIVGNTAKNGSGVYNYGTFIMHGGSIVGNTATLYGGGVCNYNATFTMEGGSIAGNTAENNGGGVSNSYKGTFTMNSGGIKDKIYQSNSTISINGGYFGEDAKNSIKPDWLGGGVSIGENDGSNVTYPKSDFPYQLG